MIKNNCYCLFCRKFFTNTDTFSMICPDCIEKENNEENFKRFNDFLKTGLSGFQILNSIEQGNVVKILNNPENYVLYHVGSYIDAWADEDAIVIDFNDNVHFVFVRKDKAEKLSTKGLIYKNNQWIENE